jgi:hypothetical protein
MTTEHLYYLLVALQVADIATTHYALSNLKGVKEGNPIMRKLFDKFGHERTLIVAKLAMVVALYFILPQVPDWSLWACVAIYVGVVGNNVKVIRTIKNRTK